MPPVKYWELAAEFPKVEMKWDLLADSLNNRRICLSLDEDIRRRFPLHATADEVSLCYRPSLTPDCYQDFTYVMIRLQSLKWQIF
jgi:hypothetical protein